MVTRFKCNILDELQECLAGWWGKCSYRYDKSV